MKRPWDQQMGAVLPWWNTLKLSLLQKKVVCTTFWYKPLFCFNFHIETPFLIPNLITLVIILYSCYLAFFSKNRKGKCFHFAEDISDMERIDIPASIILMACGYVLVRHDVLNRIPVVSVAVE